MDPAIVGFGAPSAEGEAKTQACAIRAALLERPEQCVAVSSRETPAFVPRRAHVCRYEGDPNRRVTRLPGILTAWLQRRNLELDLEEPVVAGATWNRVV